MSSQATVTIQLNEFQAIQEAKKRAEEELAALQNQIKEMKIEASDPVLLVVARSAIEVMRFAVASLPPESTKNWPSFALKKVAENLASMPDATTDDQELAITFMGFARECERFEERRRVLTTPLEQRSES